MLVDKQIPASKIEDDVWANMETEIEAKCANIKNPNDIDTIASIIDHLEVALDKAGVQIPNPERDDDDVEDAAIIYGDDYYIIENELRALVAEVLV